jgi:succinyl-CoA synthetase alpha subunit/citrate synthase
MVEGKGNGYLPKESGDSMRGKETKPFPYFVGVHSLEELVNRQSRICVINILGNESRKVTPVSHEYSKGNVVAGVQYGRRGTLETAIGNIPVYRSVLDVVRNQIIFDIGVIYLPPAAVSQAVWELVTYNKELKRIVIVTEKVTSRDSRNIRFICQEAGVDVIGCNCLGVANVWDQVRVGGALGGDQPHEALKKGSIAIHSNSGNFTTTIAEYLKSGGFGVSTAISSGKDVYIHFALPEFLYAAQNDPRTKAVALYVEPGGYYEKQALEWVESRRFGFNKPIVVCVTGRWKKDIVRACGHAGAMAGGGDDAESKERWFDEYFGIPVFNAGHPAVTKRGVRIASIQHFPAAMNALFNKIDEKPDFQATGDLSLKLWIGDHIMTLPKDMELSVTQAQSPYNEQINEIQKQVGAQVIRQRMRNASGASYLNPETQIAELHGITVLELSQRTVEENIYFALAKIVPVDMDLRKINFLLNLFLKVDPAGMNVIETARRHNCTPNAYLGSLLAIVGDALILKKIRQFSSWIIDVIREYDLPGTDEEIKGELRRKIIDELFQVKPDPEVFYSEWLLKEVTRPAKKRPPLLLCQKILSLSEKAKMHIRDKDAFMLAALTVTIFWNPMLGKRITRQTVEDASAYLYLISHMIAYSVINDSKNIFWKKLISRTVFSPGVSYSENIFKILFNRKPSVTDQIELQMLVGLTLTNGPGTISAKGAKETVSAKNHISLAFTGFLCNTGLAHGGNGFEAVKYLMDQFSDTGLIDPGERSHRIDLKSLANQAAKIYGKYKIDQKETGKLDYHRIPCINHPVFKGNDVNMDPREEYIRQQLDSRRISNVFLDFYHHLVKELFNEGVTNNVFCVNVDAVLAVITLKLIWKDLTSKKCTLKEVQDLVFTLFLIGRSIGVAAEIIDHRDRGQDMDCRTPQNEVRYIL